ncbi:MAG: alpha/beta fold hydrolase [Alphaproteobacteria bacterium]
MQFTVQGKRVYAATGGKPFDPGLPTIVFMHGAGGDHTVWALQTRWFAWHGRAVLAVDLPGHGRSDGPALETIEALADWVFDLLDAAGVASAALVGHSMGGLIALEAAARRPQRVRALALLGCAAEMPVHEGLLKAGLAGDHLAYELITSWGLGRRAQVGGAEAPGTWMTGGTLRLLEHGKKGVVGIDLRACDRYKGSAAAVQTVKTQAVLILGASDRMSPPKAAAPLAAIPGAKSIMIDQAGHMMMTEQPGRTLDALRTLL